MAAAATAAVETEPIAAGGEPTQTHIIKRMKHAFIPVVRSPACYNLRAPYDVFIPGMNKTIVSKEVLVQLPISCIEIISPRHEWKFAERLHVITEIIDSRRWT
jgi:hypothetical protein